MTMPRNCEERFPSASSKRSLGPNPPPGGVWFFLAREATRTYLEDFLAFPGRARPWVPALRVLLTWARPHGELHRIVRDRHPPVLHRAAGVLILPSFLPARSHAATHHARKVTAVLTLSESVWFLYLDS